jgi:hypothetical protein
VYKEAAVAYLKATTHYLPDRKINEGNQTGWSICQDSTLRHETNITHSKMIFSHVCFCFAIRLVKTNMVVRKGIKMNCVIHDK